MYNHSGKRIPWDKFLLDDVLLSTRAESRVPYPKGYWDRRVEIWHKRFPRMNHSGKRIPWDKFLLDDVLLSTRAESRVPYPKGYWDRRVEIWHKRFPRMNQTKHALTARYRRIVGLEMLVKI